MMAAQDKRKKDDKPKNPFEVISEHIQESIENMKLLSLEELLISIMIMDLKFEIMKLPDLVKALSSAMHSQEGGEPTALLSVWADRYKKFLLEDKGMTPENVEEGVKYYRQELNSAISKARK